MHDSSKSKSSHVLSKHCYSGLLALSYRWHGNCPVHGCKGVCPGDGGGWHPEERNWSTDSENLAPQARVKCFKINPAINSKLRLYLIQRATEVIIHISNNRGVIEERSSNLALHER